MKYKQIAPDLSPDDPINMAGIWAQQRVNKNGLKAEFDRLYNQLYTVDDLGGKIAPGRKYPWSDNRIDRLKEIAGQLGEWHVRVVNRLLEGNKVRLPSYSRPKNERPTSFDGIVQQAIRFLSNNGRPEEASYLKDLYHKGLIRFDPKLKDKNPSIKTSGMVRVENGERFIVLGPDLLRIDPGASGQLKNSLEFGRLVDVAGTLYHEAHHHKNSHGPYKDILRLTRPEDRQQRDDEMGAWKLQVDWLSELLQKPWTKYKVGHIQDSVSRASNEYQKRYDRRNRWGNFGPWNDQ